MVEIYQKFQRKMMNPPKIDLQIYSLKTVSMTAYLGFSRNICRLQTDNKFKRRAKRAGGTQHKISGVSQMAASYFTDLSFEHIMFLHLSIQAILLSFCIYADHPPCAEYNVFNFKMSVLLKYYSVRVGYQRTQQELRT